MTVSMACTLQIRCVDFVSEVTFCVSVVSFEKFILKNTLKQGKHISKNTKKNPFSEQQLTRITE